MIEIIPPSDELNGYFFDFNIDGKSGRGYLTYDLLSDKDFRTLLLTSR